MAIATDTDPRAATGQIATSGKLFLIAVLAFISLGLPDGTLGVAWPSIKSTFGVPISGLGVLLFAGTIGYLISSSQSGHVLARLGVGRLLFWSTVLTASSSLGYAVLPAWPLLIVLAMIGGLGAGAIDAGTNAYAAANFTPAKITWLHASYGIGAAAGPLLMSWVVGRQLPWQLGYLLLASALAALACMFWRARQLWTNGVVLRRDTDAASAKYRIRDALRHPAVWINIALFFLYTGLESTAGQWAFSLLTMARDWDAQTAGIATSAYWCSLTAGRIAFGIAAHRLQPTAILRIGMVTAPIAAWLLTTSESNSLTFAALGWLGFAFAPIFPCLIAETPRRAGTHLSDHAIGLQVSAAYVGVAAVPSIVGILARTYGLEIVGPCLVVGTIALLMLHEFSLASSWRSKTCN